MEQRVKSGIAVGLASQRQGRSAEDKTAARLELALEIVAARGRLAESGVNGCLARGLTDPEIAEVAGARGWKRASCGLLPKIVK